MKQIYAGVDIGGTTVKLGLFTEDGNLLEKWEIPTRKGENGVLIFGDAAASLKGAAKKRGLEPEELKGIGMGLPGVLSPEGHLERCVNVAMEDLYPARELSAYFPGVTVRAGNDANVAALGEMWQGGGKGCNDVVMVTLGTGVGGGVIAGGCLVTGARGMGGELGHLRVNLQETDPCNCGNRGCLEQYASATGIVKEMKRTLAESEAPSVLRDAADMTCKDVLDAAKAGDAPALETVERCMGYLALAMHYTAHVADPEVFVIGGGVSKAGDFLLEIILRQFEACMFLSKEKAQVRLAALGNDAGIYGAARLVLEE